MTQILRSTQKQPEGEKELHEKGSDLPTDTSALLSRIHPPGDSEGQRRQRRGSWMEGEVSSPPGKGRE